ncbi:hypothetical protein K1719_026128 [Acacia pycnantha]|nr:hypothetical protein K1719_026128 [Acacia pycnantha]
MVDTSKSKNSHALCDLGLAITKRLVQKDVDLEGLSSLVSLPSMLYKVCEKKEGDDSLVKAIDEEMRTGFLGIGFEPKWGLKDIPIMPKEFLCLLSIVLALNLLNMNR